MNPRDTCVPRPTGTAVSPADPDLEQRLRREPLTVLGRFASASNATLLCRLGDGRGEDELVSTGTDGQLVLADGAADHLAVYKPRLGEAPLWDFPDGTLYRREIATYVVSEALGWSLVPLTVERDGPYGVGSVQRFVAHDPDRHYFALIDQAAPPVLDQLRRMVAFDLLINNADRKGGHVLVDADEHVWLVDHGVTFHAEPKLRTVAWEFALEPVPDELRRAADELGTRLRADDGGLASQLQALLRPLEVEALLERCVVVADLDRFPEPVGPRPYPWPLL